MKKLLIAAAAASVLVAAPARAALHGGDWADIISVVIGAAGAAAQGYAAAQQANQVPVYNVVYTGWSMDPNVGLLCHYSDGSQRPYPTLSECPAYFQQ